MNNIDSSSVPLTKPNEPQSWNRFYLGFGIVLVILSAGLLYISYDIYQGDVPNLWMYAVVFVVGVVLIVVFAQKVHEENKKKKQMRG